LGIELWSFDPSEVLVALAIERTIRAQATRLGVPSVVHYLLDQLGERLTSVIAGTTEAGEVRAWAAGEAAPSAVSEQRLRVAYEVTRLLRQKDSAETVRLWFRGMNPALDDRAPALAIAEDTDSVLVAARGFLAHG
jgi:hypothetical protein